MAGPDYGALGATFKIVRLLQVVALLGCIGMAANFISEMVNNNDTPSKELVGTLSVVCNISPSHAAGANPFGRLASPSSTVRSRSFYMSTISFHTS